jgi:hypothetical protein
VTVNISERRNEKGQSGEDQIMPSAITM